LKTGKNGITILVTFWLALRDYPFMLSLHL
jgi:hypothetical protein